MCLRPGTLGKAFASSVPYAAWAAGYLYITANE